MMKHSQYEIINSTKINCDELPTFTAYQKNWENIKFNFKTKSLISTIEIVEIKEDEICDNLLPIEDCSHRDFYGNRLCYTTELEESKELVLYQPANKRQKFN